MRVSLIAYLFLVSGLFSLSVNINAQQCRLCVEGTVLDSATQEVICCGNVVVAEIWKSVQIDSSGKYKICGLCPGKYNLYYDHPLSGKDSTKIDLRTNLTVHLSPVAHFEWLEGVTINKHEDEEPHNMVDKKTLLQSMGKPLAERLKTIVGVDALTSGNGISKPVIHGMHSNRVLIMNNGIRLEGQQWGNEHAPEIDPFIAKNLTVIKGAQSVLYGSDAIAGVVLVEPDALPNANGINGEVNTGFSSNGRQGLVSAKLEGRQKLGIPIGWRIQGTLKKSGNTHTPNLHLDNTGLEEGNFSLALGTKGKRYGIEGFYSQFNTNIGIFSGSHIGNLTDLQAAFDGTRVLEDPGFTYTIDRPYQNITHELTKFNAYYLLNDNQKLSLTYARQYNLRQEYDSHHNDPDDLDVDPELRFSLTTHTTDLKWDYFSDQHFKLIAGISGIHQENTFRGRFFVPNFLSNGIGAYLFQETEWKGWEIQAGVRYDLKSMKVYRRNTNDSIVQTNLQFNNLSANLTFSKSITDHFKWTLNVARAWRPPAISELYANGVHHGSASYEIGDENLKEEHVWNFSSEFHYQHKRFDAELNLYYNYFSNYIYASPSDQPTLTIRGAFPTFNFLNTRAHVYGADFFFHFESESGFYASQKTGIVLAKDLDKNGFLPLIPAPRFNQSVGYEVESRDEQLSWYTQINWLMTLKQTRVSDQIDFTPPPDGYHLFGIETGISMKTKTGAPMNIGINIQNILNTSYRDYLNRMRYFADDLGRNVSVNVSIPIGIYKPK